MARTEISATVYALSNALGFNMEDITSIVIKPHQVEVTSTYTNGAGKTLTNTTYHATSITIMENN